MKEAAANGKIKREETTDMVSDRVLSLIKQDLRKFVKVFTYLKIRADMRASDLQIQEHRETNKAKAMENQILICMKSVSFRLEPKARKDTTLILSIFQFWMMLCCFSKY